MSKPAWEIGLAGYGEVGQIFGPALQAATGRWLGAWDKLFMPGAPGDAHRRHAQAHGVQACASAAALCERAQLIVSAVTASNTLAVAQEVARSIRPGTFFLDLNSASPGTKAQAAQAIEAAGGCYVEAGVMTSVPPYGIRVPMLLGGPRAHELAPVLTAWGMDASVVAPTIGVASAIKMCRSVMIKGLEALVIESYATARAYGVEAAMIPTLYETFPGIDWNQQGAYFFSRVVQHGQRRSEEMREAANTVREAGFEPLITRAIADKQAWVAAQAATGLFAGLDGQSSWPDYADRLLQKK